MWGDQFGEFVCGYWGLKVKYSCNWNTIAIRRNRHWHIYLRSPPDPVRVITEYVPYGDLLGFLRKSRGLQDNYYKDPDIKPQSSLRPKQLFGFAWDIANGMEFLASEKVCMLWDVNDTMVSSYSLLKRRAKAVPLACHVSGRKCPLRCWDIIFLKRFPSFEKSQFTTVGHWLSCWKRTRKYSIRHASRTLFYSFF